MQTFSNQIELIKYSKEVSKRGIEISTLSGVDPFSPDKETTGKSGRPRSNILNASLAAKGQKLNYRDLSFKRSEVLVRHKLWRNSTKLLKNAKSFEQKQNGNPIWTVYFTAEVATILMGRQTPEPFYDQPVYFLKRGTFASECYSLWFFINRMVLDAKYRQKQSGPCPDPEKLFKTAVATYVARKLIHPKGGYPSFVPSPRYISQAWFLVFGELEPHDHIKNRLRTAGQYCEAFPRYEPKAPTGRFASLGKALTKKYGTNKANL